MNKKPIAVFDSGYGGLSILKELQAALPQYDFMYLGDNARSPYGGRSFETVYQYTLEAVQWLFNQGCPLIILACNTASAKALRTIQQKDLPRIALQNRVLGIIRPTAEVIASHTRTGHIGILGTVGTVESGSYPIEIHKISPHLHISQQACPMWVPLVENNEQLQPGADYFVKKYLQEIIQVDPAIDTLLLACTHYPLMLPKLQQFCPPHVHLLAQGNIVAASLVNYLQRHPEIEERCAQNKNVSFFTTGDTVDFNTHGTLFYGSQVEAMHVVL